jgi:hypothetical protein
MQHVDYPHHLQVQLQGPSVYSLHQLASHATHVYFTALLQVAMYISLVRVDTWKLYITTCSKCVKLTSRVPLLLHGRCADISVQQEAACVTAVKSCIS